MSEDKSLEFCNIYRLFTDYNGGMLKAWLILYFNNMLSKGMLPLHTFNSAQRKTITKNSHTPVGV